MLIETFKNMRQSAEQSVVIISHQERILQLADEIMLIAAGKISNFGPRSEVLPGLRVDAADDLACPAPATWRTAFTTAAQDKECVS